MPTPVGNEGSHTIDGLTVKGGLAIMGQGAGSGNTSRTVYVNSDAAATATRYQALMDGLGYFAETFPGGGIGGSGAISGTVYYVAIGLAAGDVVTNIHTRCITAGATFSGIGMKVGVYSKALQLLGSSGDVSPAHLSTGGKVNALSAPLSITTTDLYYLAMIAVATTPPVLNRGGAGGLFSAFGTFAGSAGNQSAQTDLPATASITFNTGMLQYWFGVS